MKHAKLFIAFVCILVMLGVTSCSSGSDDEPTNSTLTNPTERKLIIEVGTNSWLDENGNARETRGAVTTTETLQGFLMNWYQSEDYQSQYTVSRGSNNDWNPAPGNWPSSVANDTPISFYAHTAGNFYYKDGNRYISFSAENAAANQHDLLLSKITDVTYTGTGGVIWFTFDHACAAVDFNIQITNKLWTQLGTGLTVNSVVLKNIARTGDCYYSTGEWKDVGKPQGNESSGYTDYTLTQGQLTVTTTPQALSCNTMFIIPQTLGANAKLVIDYTFNGQTKTTAEISLEGTEWKAGHLYPINIVLGTTLIK